MLYTILLCGDFYMIEVEVKARVESFTPIKKLLIEKLNVDLDKIEYQEDTYFNSPYKDFAITDEAFRIRKISVNNETQLFITYKGPKIDSKSKTRIEYETNIGDSQIARNIFENLGFIVAADVIKTREIYHFDDFEITLDSVKNAGTFIEIEKTLEDNDDYNKSLNDIFVLFEKLGITNGFERKSYLEIIMDSN